MDFCMMKLKDLSILYSFKKQCEESSYSSSQAFTSINTVFLYRPLSHSLSSLITETYLTEEIPPGNYKVLH